MSDQENDKLDLILSKIDMLEQRLNLFEDKLREINFEGCWLRHQNKQENDDKTD